MSFISKKLLSLALNGIFKPTVLKRIKTISSKKTGQKNEPKMDNFDHCGTFMLIFVSKFKVKKIQNLPKWAQMGQKSLPNNETKMGKIDHCVLFLFTF